jgi:hypothetical protein
VRKTKNLSGKMRVRSKMINLNMQMIKRRKNMLDAFFIGTMLSKNG